MYEVLHLNMHAFTFLAVWQIFCMLLKYLHNCLCLSYKECAAIRSVIIEHTAYLVCHIWCIEGR